MPLLVAPGYVQVKILGWSEPIPVGCEKNQQKPSAGSVYLLRATWAGGKNPKQSLPPQHHRIQGI